MSVVCDVCKDAGAFRVTISRAGKNLASMDICDGCVTRFEATTPHYPKKSAAARRRLTPFVPKELTDSVVEDESDDEAAEVVAGHYAALSDTPEDRA